MQDVKKILVFRLSSIGDIVLTTALLRCLRNTYPDAQIDFVVKKQFADILKCVPFVSRVIEVDSKLGFQGLKAVRPVRGNTHHSQELAKYVCMQHDRGKKRVPIQ